MEDQLENELKSKNKNSNIAFLKKKELEMDKDKLRKISKIGEIMRKRNKQFGDRKHGRVGEDERRTFAQNAENDERTQQKYGTHQLENQRDEGGD